MTQLRLHYAPDNASLCVRLTLEALAVAYDTVLVARSEGGHKTPAYLALNPNGLIPVLETPDGPVFETGAIMLWLSEQQDHALMPAPGTPDRAQALQWMLWLANTVHPALRMLFYPDQHIATDTKALRAKTKERLKGMLDLLEATPRAPWLDAPGPTLPGLYLAPMLRWLQIYGGRPGWLTLAPWPRIMRFAQRADAWPATAAAVAAEGLGPTPFSAPQIPNPPEGSVF